MTNLDQRKPGEKSGKNKKKRSKKTEQKSPKPDQVLAAEELIDATTPPADPVETEAVVALAVIEQTAAAIAPVEKEAPVEEPAPVRAALAKPVASFKERMASVMPPMDTATGKPPVQADTAQAVPSPAATPVGGIQAIANAYRDYTRKSLEDAQSFAEKLTAARSLDKAVEAQAEFAKNACENYAANSRKIRELHRELFWQAFRMPDWPLGKSR
ncbi:MAG: TIGR01841 family phasin [Bradyrhizobium sp.]|nr:TIGR01841 family phasin [Bradyrhizobium sp.]